MHGKSDTLYSTPQKKLFDIISKYINLSSWNKKVIILLHIYKNVYTWITHIMNILIKRFNM